MNWQHIPRTLFIYLLASFAYSFIHVGGMVAIRKLAYFSQNRIYDFGNIVFEMFYEYRKDLWAFVFVIIAINCYHFVLSRLLGEANLLDQSEEEQSSVTPDRLLVRKLGKEFLVKVSDIEYLESAGNYVNLHSKGRIYPTRNTMNKLIDKLNGQGFCRVHRSYSVNLDEISSMTPQPSGDSDIVLASGKTIPLSRRYKDELRQHLHI
jgi:DNA-binding LytR/AlgR family response regulator